MRVITRGARCLEEHHQVRGGLAHEEGDLKGPGRGGRNHGWGERSSIKALGVDLLSREWPWYTGKDTADGDNWPIYTKEMSRCGSP